MLFNDFKNIKNPTRQQYLAVLLDDQYLKKVFKTIPQELLDLEFYKDAIKANSKTLELVPEEFKTKDFYLVLVSTTHSLKLVPDNFKDNEFLLKVIDLYPLIFSEIQNKTYEMCVKALKQSPQLYDYVPLNLRSLQLTLDVVKENDFILKYVMPEHVNEEICEIAVSQNGWILEYVPRKYKIYDLCLKAVSNNFSGLSNVPFDLIDLKMVDLALGQNPKALRVVPKEWQSAKVCLEMIEKDSSCYAFVKICDNPDLDQTIKNLQVILNKELVHRTIDGL